jgi:hypothetical protein
LGTVLQGRGAVGKIPRLEVYPLANFPISKLNF